MARQRTILIAGALGVVGRAAVDHFCSSERWKVVGLSRRQPDFATSARFLSVDLLDAEATASALSGLEVSHILYAALHEEPDLVAGWRAQQQMRTNLEMLRNLLNGISRGGDGDRLEHLTLLQGTKAYGHHVERMPIPGKEDRPRHAHESFYWLQEDLVRERSARDGWSWTVLRPQAMFGWALGGQMNVIAAAGAYAALMREIGRPMSFPGAGFAVKEATDAEAVRSSVCEAGLVSS